MKDDATIFCGIEVRRYGKDAYNGAVYEKMENFQGTKKELIEKFSYILDNCEAIKSIHLDS